MTVSFQSVSVNIATLDQSSQYLTSASLLSLPDALFTRAPSGMLCACVAGHRACAEARERAGSSVSRATIQTQVTSCRRTHVLNKSTSCSSTFVFRMRRYTEAPSQSPYWCWFVELNTFLLLLLFFLNTCRLLSKQLNPRVGDLHINYGALVWDVQQAYQYV